MGGGGGSGGGGGDGPICKLVLARIQFRLNSKLDPSAPKAKSIFSYEPNDSYWESEYQQGSSTLVLL